MDGIGNFISMMDYILDTKRKRHITGGILNRPKISRHE